MVKKRLYMDSAIIGLAIAMRVAAVLVLQSHQVPRSSYEHGEIGANLLAGRGFSMHFLGADGPTSQQAPFIRQSSRWRMPWAGSTHQRRSCSSSWASRSWVACSCWAC